jgi:hypothetical protein
MSQLSFETPARQDIAWKLYQELLGRPRWRWEDNILTHRPKAMQWLSEHIQRQRITNNRGYSLLGNGCFLCGPTRIYVIKANNNWQFIWRGSVVRSWECPVEDGDLWHVTNRIKVKYINSVAFSPQANYTDRATAACRRSYCQLLLIQSVAWSAQRIPPPRSLIRFSWPEVKYIRSSNPKSVL